ncbi:MAG: response regulator transcription factor [Roseivirga sp.]|nr:response regulator transcription factor [Roseivirga sp.]
MILKCVVVDDEAIARSLLADYVSKIPELELIATCATALEAMPHIRSGKVDLLFLDIEMPEITGIDFLKSLGPGPQVILTTAYSEYAIQSYEYGVADYLLKPIEFNRFYKSVNRILANANIPAAANPQPAAAEAEKTDDFLFVKADNKVLKVNYADIQYITSKGAYVQIVTTAGKKIMTLQSMNKMEEVLPPATFFRVHRSHIINISYVNAIEGNTLRLADDMMISLSKSKKDDFIQRIDKANLLG